MTGIPRFAEYESDLRAEHGSPGDRIVTVSGFTGVGTTTVASILADAFDLERIDAGDFFREKAREHGMTIDEFDSEAARIEEEQDVDFDLMWDRTAMKHAFTDDDIVLEGRLTGALLQDIAAVRVYVECDPRTVAERMRGRETVSEEVPDEESLDAIRSYV
ncbi:MAG: AAA family ATPase, partial [Candidatus Nanohaloarchaea archaeon]